MQNNQVIVIDADGVTFDYRQSYPIVWKKAFGTELKVVRPDSYHAHIMYGLDFSKDKKLEAAFFAHFGADIWADLPPCPGAVEACQTLHELGFTLLCVSSMPSEFAAARKINFEKLGMPVAEVIATGRIKTENPKLKIVNDINPVAFVDDLATNFIGINQQIHRALIHGNHHDNPNNHHQHLTTTVHTDLADFTQYWAGQLQ